MKQRIARFVVSHRPLHGAVRGLFPLLGLFAACAALAQEPATEPAASGDSAVAMPEGEPPAAPHPAPSAIKLEPLGDTATGVTYERWAALPGVRVGPARAAALGAPLRGAARAPVQVPAARGVAPSLAFPRDDGAAYLARVRGYLVPSRTGSARLVIASDDNSELWLSTSSDPFARRRAAWVIGEGFFGATKPGETGRFSSQWTAPIRLEQGRRYYFELWHKQSGGADHLSLRWIYDGDKGVSEIPRAELHPYTPPREDSADDDGLPDDWQRDKGLDGRPDRGSWADADGDGVCNFAEFAAGTDPLNPASESGVLLWERWHGIYGAQVADLLRDTRFTGGADDAEFVRSGMTPVSASGNHASRLSGCLVPAESGEFQLAVSGDDATELWFSPGGGPVDKQRVAFGTTWRAREDWNVPPCQRSGVFALEAGKSYYFEILQKNGSGIGWSALGWRKPADKSFATVPPAFLRSPGVSSGDNGRNFLPTRWVTETLAAFPEKERARVVITQHGDPDHDGLPNWLEARLNTDPFARSQVRETWIREWWFKVPGNSIDLARRKGVFLRPPSMLTLSHGPASEAYTADNFASRYRAYLTPPVSGKYRFWIAGDDQVELWLSATGPKFEKRLIAAAKPAVWQNPTDSAWTGRADWDRYPGQRSELIDLREGHPYYIEVLHKDGGADDHMAVAWQYRSNGSDKWTERKPVAVSALLSYDGDDDDGDDDFLPDSWERRHLLDPRDNGSRDPARQGENGDFDKDGLSNRTEYLLGTDPGNPDTDGDGVDDRTEVEFYGSDPTRKDASPPVLLARLPLSPAAASSGFWFATAEGGLISSSRRGTAALSFDLDAPGIYLVEVLAVARAAGSYVPDIPFIVRVDATEVGRAAVGAAPAKGAPPPQSWLTPWLPAGRHTVVIDNRNVRSGVSLEIRSVSLLRHEGEDANSNAIPDWMEKPFYDRNTLAGNSPDPIDTPVSPVCVEGVSRFPGDAVFAAATLADPLRATPAIGSGWFANLPLDPTAEAVTTVTAAFENGALTRQASFRWVETNLLAAPERVRVRRGDAMKFTAYLAAAGETETTVDLRDVTLAMDGGKLEQSIPAEPLVITFDHPGTHRLEFAASAAGQPVAAAVTVEVVEADFGETFDLAAGSARLWALPGIAPGLAVEADTLLSLAELPATAGLPRRFNAFYPPDMSGTPCVLARLEPGGPVAAATRINAFYFVPSSVTGDYNVIQVLPDGTRVIEVRYVIDGGIPKDLSVWLQLFVTDALFANGDSWYRLTAADFDANGEARILIYKAPGTDTPYVCHWIRPFYDREPADGGDTAAPATAPAAGAER